MTKTYIVTFIAHIHQHIVKTSVTSKTAVMLILRLLKTRNNVHRKRHKVATKRHIVRQNRRTNVMYLFTQTTDSLYKTQSIVLRHTRDVTVSVRERRDAVGQQKTFVVDRRQTSLAQFASRDLVPRRPESAKLALGRTPAVEDVQILLVSYVLLHVALRYALRFRVRVSVVVRCRRPQTVQCTSCF